ncbi:MAG: nucleotidyltransferase family protein, partial [Myxococcales bacterium]|nr:nucleotidyltransferase family protein [Myxococcales bacterium]
MIQRLRSAEDRTLVDALRAGSPPARLAEVDLGALFGRAERHGLAGVLHDRCNDAGVVLPVDLERSIAVRGAARACDHAAHLDMLHRMDAALGTAGLRAVALKGALLAERLYPRPSARPTTDIDLLVCEQDLELAARALESLGYTPSTAASEEHFRRAGHHLHLLHPAAPCIELHFHAYRGFGRILRSEPLVGRSRAVPGFASVRVLAPEDELLYLAVHAAGHRFMRLVWLYDLLLLLQQLDDDAPSLSRA